MCITTVDKEVTERIKHFVHRTKQVLAMPNAVGDRFQTLKFIMMNPLPQYDVQIRDITKGKTKNEEEERSNLIFRTVEPSKSQLKANSFA